jgi:hypothetical protein
VTERMGLTAATVLVGMLGAGLWCAATATPASFRAADSGEIAAATGAVRAWAWFAETADTRKLSGWFAPDGPQYSQMESEVMFLVPGGSYEFSLSDARVVAPGLVRGSITVTTGSGDDQTYDWDIEMIKEDGRWLVWTVRTSP